MADLDFTPILITAELGRVELTVVKVTSQVNAIIIGPNATKNLQGAVTWRKSLRGRRCLGRRETLSF